MNAYFDNLETRPPEEREIAFDGSANGAGGPGARDLPVRLTDSPG